MGNGKIRVIGVAYLDMVLRIRIADLAETLGEHRGDFLGRLEELLHFRKMLEAYEREETEKS